jgi:CBS domain
LHEVASEAEDLLFQPCGGFGHQILITLAPQFVSMKKRTGHAGARGFHKVLGQGTAIEQEQLAMPEYDSGPIALGTRSRLPGDVAVGEVMSRKLHFCAPDEEIHMALQTMKEGKVRRLPVIAKKGSLVGVISMDDVAKQAAAA